MCVLININFITDTLRNLRSNNEKGDVSYSDFLNEILSGVSKSLGGFNEFRILVDDTSKSFRIIDDNKTLSYKEFDDEKQYTELPIFGKNSIVYYIYRLNNCQIFQIMKNSEMFRLLPYKRRLKVYEDGKIVGEELKNKFM